MSTTATIEATNTALKRSHAQKRERYRKLVRDAVNGTETDPDVNAEILNEAGVDGEQFERDCKAAQERISQAKLAAQLPTFNAETSKVEAEIQDVVAELEEAKRLAAAKLVPLNARRIGYGKNVEAAIMARNWLMQNVPEEIAQAERELMAKRKPLADRLKRIQDYLNDHSSGGGAYARMMYERRVEDAKSSGSPKRAENVKEAEAALSTFVDNRIKPLEAEAVQLREQLAALDVEQEKLHRAKLEA